jgi:hypothetical protein
MSKPQFTFATEEYLKPEVINSIIKYVFGIIDNKLIDTIITNFSIKYIYTNLEIKILYVDKYLSRGQPMIDLCIYNDFLTIDEINTIPPNYIIEITKNDTGDSGNQVYQRIEKFIYAKEHWHSNWDSITKYMFYTIEIENSCNHIPSIISNKMFLTLGINVIKYIIPTNQFTSISITLTPFNSIQSICELVNSTRPINGININNRIFENDSDLCITSNLIHSRVKQENSPINDPNIGFVVGLISVIDVIAPEKQIVLTKECGLYDTQIQSSSKLWSCLRRYKDKITIFNNEGVKIEKKWNTLNDIDSKYFKQPQGEKLSSLYIHLYMENCCNCELVFHNHAGCERSFIQLNGTYYMPTAKNIPDLCMIDYERHILYIIEAKQNDAKKIKSGIKQLSKSVEWVKANILTKLTDVFTIEKYICVFGSDTHPTDYVEFNDDVKLLFSLKTDNSTYFNPEFITRYGC